MDLYTKAVLTVIALCLVILVARSEFPAAQAASGTIDCRIVGVSSSVRLPVELEKVKMRAVPVESADTFRGLPVRVMNANELKR